MRKNILVVTATLGDRDTLSRTISSVREIGGERVKHIIVAPTAVLSKIQSKYNDIECIAEPEGKKGIYAALNYSFRKYARDYEYITFINDDDYWLPEYNSLIEVVDKNNSLDFVYGRTMFVDDKNKVICSQLSAPMFGKFLPLIQGKIVLLTQQATLIKSSIYFKLGGFDERFKLIADSKFWVDCSLLHIKYRYLNRICAAYMSQEGQLSKNKDLLEQDRQLWKKSYLECNILNIFFSKLFFRFYNIPAYIKRVLFWGLLKHPNMYSR